MSHDKARCQLLFCAACALTRKWQRLKAARKRRRPNAATGCPTTMPDASSALRSVPGLCARATPGKQKAHDEVRMWQLGAHEPDCGCNPCLSALAVVLEFVSANSKPMTLPDRHLEDCAGPGCGASCACWCHAALRS